MKNGEKNIAIEIKKFDVEIGRYLFEVNKDNKQPSPLQGRIIKYLSKHEGEDVIHVDFDKMSAGTDSCDFGCDWNIEEIEVSWLSE